MNNNNEISEIVNKNIFCEKSKPEILFDMPSTHFHNHYEIYYLLSGKRRYLIGNQIYNLNKGDIVLIPKRVLHKTTILDNSYHQRLLISFNDNMFYPEFQKKFNQCFERCFYSIPSTLKNQFETIIFNIEKEYIKNDEFSEQIIKGLLFELFTFLIRFADKLNSEHTKTKSDTDVQNIAEFISKNYERAINLNETAKLFAFSPEHLSRKFKKVTGFGFNEYLTIVRIMQAEKLLNSTKLSVMEIASRCGFNDSNYFSYVFKQIKGISPHIYRKQLNH